ncbi:MAG: 4a-hydroxytetrahydrobiopterin dehydratase [Bacteroidetes bacterium]|nr:4a-hydroxytetrahydrobiopterin dehydratase [Rhodothermia bacterium]MCS7155705.1 4a-hydroxytetrahydrobiopterin dehydratase [Bacteroidota bacterium]MCX7906564.1 4a-hydroxytetrahydrobiopterin dehydratase [Bacteroidota bacterium]MDW8137155.1 4a-hydroxytetrahydrobiopterin dehydratase [Bacteroidota bacterium]MDW8284975.1 4a-hydroxytetrahydrobiopterin dehydratase [Bacteroidota bacterium]
MARPLEGAELEAALSQLPGWSIEGDRLVREFRFRSFPEALSFLIRVGFAAERLGHHPEIYNVYATVRLQLCTHEAGNRITERDVALAREINRFAWV